MDLMKKHDQILLIIEKIHLKQKRYARERVNNMKKFLSVKGYMENKEEVVFGDKLQNLFNEVDNMTNNIDKVAAEAYDAEYNGENVLGFELYFISSTDKRCSELYVEFKSLIKKYLGKKFNETFKGKGDRM